MSKPWADDEDREVLQRLAGRSPEIHAAELEDPIDYERGVRALQRAEPVDDEVELSAAAEMERIRNSIGAHAAAVAAERDRLRHALTSIRTFTGEGPHINMGEACGADACAGCLIWAVADEALAKDVPGARARNADLCAVDATTYEWECGLCGARTWTPAAGGVLDWDCKCDHDTTGSDGHGINVYKIFGGRREFVNTAAGVEGRGPGEPSNRKRHLETCDGTCDGCLWHAGLLERMKDVTP